MAPKVVEFDASRANAYPSISQMEAEDDSLLGSSCWPRRLQAALLPTRCVRGNRGEVGTETVTYVFPKNN
jgi:hypothetical protein